MNKIDADIFLSDILKRYPETLEVFLANGFEDFAENEAFIEISPFIKLKTILKARNINEKFFVAMLEDKIKTGLNSSILQQPQLETKARMNLLALLPCPLKVPLQEEFKRFLQSSSEEFHSSLDYLIEGNANNQLSYYQYVDRFEDIDEIPDIVISPGINNFYHKRFIERFIDKGLFIDASGYSCENSIVKTNIKDPGNNYTIFCANILVMVADLTKSEGNTLPKSWSDLLKPEYYKKVAIRGQNDFFCETTLLTIFKEYGYEGIEKLGKSVKYGWHPSQMVKSAGKNLKDAPFISIMPYFFARTIRNKENIKIIWPEEGAIISPVTMLVKKEKYDQLSELVSLFTGPQIGKICAGAFFPSLNPHVDNKLDKNSTFYWLGWDFIKSNDIGKLIESLNKQFLRSFRGDSL